MVANNELVTGAFVNQQTYLGGLTLYRCTIYIYIYIYNVHVSGWKSPRLGMNTKPLLFMVSNFPKYKKKTGLTWSKHIKTIQNRYKWMEMDGTKNEKQKKQQRTNQPRFLKPRNTAVPLRSTEATVWCKSSVLGENVVKNAGIFVDLKKCAFHGEMEGNPIWETMDIYRCEAPQICLLVNKSPSNVTFVICVP